MNKNSPLAETCAALAIGGGMSLTEYIRYQRNSYKQVALKQTKGNISQAARLSKVHRNTFSRKSKWQQ